MAGTINIPAEVRWSLALAAKAELELAGRPLTAGELARYTGWSPFVAKKTVAVLRRDGLWPDLPDPSAVARERTRARRERVELADSAPDPAESEPVQEEPDIAAECARIREDWPAARWAQQIGHRAAVRVATGKVTTTGRAGP